MMGFVHAFVPLSGLVLGGTGMCRLRVMNKMNVMTGKAGEQLASR
jgi:hypothetical protein